jgi:hypothetical protein
MVGVTTFKIRQISIKVPQALRKMTISQTFIKRWKELISIRTEINEMETKKYKGSNKQKLVP